jgi:hypothetical protein
VPRITIAETSSYTCRLRSAAGRDLGQYRDLATTILPVEWIFRKIYERNPAATTSPSDHGVERVLLRPILLLLPPAAGDLVFYLDCDGSTGIVEHPPQFFPYGVPRRLGQ